MALPAGQTLSDLLPAIPVLLQRVGGGSPSSAPPEHSCADSEPAGYDLVKQVTLTLPPAAAGQPSQALSVCLFQQFQADRADKITSSGRVYQLLAVQADGSSIAGDLPELARPPKRLPPERVRGGHEATGWAALVASGDAEMPVLAVATARFYDGPLGEEVHFIRQAKVLRRQGAGWAWLPLVERAFSVTDWDHLQALCAGKADACDADRAAGALQVACDKVEAAEATREEGRLARLATRKKRLAGGGGGNADLDPDPQSLWLRDAMAAVRKGEHAKAVELALKVDAMCGESAAEAHALIRESLAAAQLEAVKSQPAQSLVELCEPLADKPAPKRPRQDKAAKPPVRPAKPNP